MPAPARSSDDWSRRWPALARAAGIEDDEKLLLALSGGADSVLLLHWLACARPAAAVRAAHVDHGLRGEESAADARFAANLSRALGVPFACLRAELDPAGPALEARARAERYRLLALEARRSGHRTILTGHHSDDALETVLMRWVRGTDLAGLRGPRAELDWHADAGGEPDEPPVRIVRPLLTLRREEVRALLSARGLTWREDSSNADRRFTRSRVRHGLLPLVRQLGGEQAVEELRAFSRAVEELEGELARATAHLVWRPAPYAAAARAPEQRALGGVLARGELMSLARPLARRALWRLLTEGTGRAPSRTVLERVLLDLGAGRATRHSLSAGWSLLLRARELVLLPPRRAQAPEVPRTEQLLLPFPSLGATTRVPPALPLGVPGIVTLPDGRRISAELARVPRGMPVPQRELEAELDAAELPAALGVRFPAPGDRFRALGAPGSKRLTRFLAGRGVPRDERGQVPLVTTGSEILWVAGLAPSERRRVHARTEWRLRLALHG
jgi:tRNA(Ile)-lysidine synthase